LAKAFILVNVEIGADIEVLNDLGLIPEVREAHRVYGVYNIIAIAETSTMQELKDVVGFKIRSLDRVHSTMTMIVVW
jgi:DNA-binding Lrp family transcriptional regulator